jgi:SAM-dependent methyltransferase
MTSGGTRPPLQVLEGPNKFTPSTYITRVRTRHILSFCRPNPWPPTFLYSSTSWIDDEAYSLPLRLVRAVNPDLVRVKHEEGTGWTDGYELTKADKAIWMKLLGFEIEKVLLAHLTKIRELAWQEAQEISIGRWWFLQSRLILSPYYPEITKLARIGASIADLACGFGQESRWLRADDATGKIWAVDTCPKLWELSLELFKDAPGRAEFIQANLISDSLNSCGLHALHDKIDIFLLDDFLSFMGPMAIEGILQSIAYASKPNLIVIGWVFGTNQIDDKLGLMWETIWGNGSQGMIHHPVTFRQETWSSLEKNTSTKWDLRLRLLEPEELGFFSKDLLIINWNPPLKILYFMALRIS